MHQIGKFAIMVNSGRRRLIFKSNNELVVELLVDREHTHVVIDCSGCKHLLKNNLPRGELIAVVSALRKFFNGRQMKNVNVSVAGSTMHREYEGVVDVSIIDELRQAIVDSVTRFSKKRH